MKVYNKYGQEINLVDFNYLNCKQLLLNNDFQVNQRGQTLYNGDYSKYTYTIDMWEIVTTSQSETCTLEKLAQGVKFSSNGTGRANFEQRIEVDISKNHTAACYIRNLVGNGIFAISVGSVWERTELKNGLNIISVPSGANADRCIVALLDTSNCEIEYIDLFEGDIAYPHVKEDKAIALMRCQKKYFKINNMSLPCLVVNVHGVCDQLLCWIYLPQTMENPIVSISHIEVKPVNVSVGYECELTESVIYENTVRISLKKKNNEKFNFGTERDYIVYLSGIEFSNEPL